MNHSVSILVGFIGAILIGANTANATRTDQLVTDHDVLIVGAGSAGMYAAYKLMAMGYDVHIVEAEDYHGGRVVWNHDNPSFADFPVELHAEEVVGGPGNFLYDDIDALTGADNVDLVQDFVGGVTQDTLYSIDGTTFWGSDGPPCPGEICDDVYDYWDFYYTDVPSHLGDCPDLSPGPPDPACTDIPVSDHLNTVHGVSTSHQAYHLYNWHPGSGWATSMTKLGLHSLARSGNRWPISGGNYILANASYIEALERAYFKPTGTPLANTVVGQISYDSPVNTVDYNSSRPFAIDDNDVYHYADAVVVTVPVAVLKEESIDFDPDLPAEKVTAYNTIGTGPGMKLILKFGTAFWDTNRMYSLVTEGHTQGCWLPGKLRTGATNNIFTCYIMGDDAAYMNGLANDVAIVDEALDDIDAMFLGSPARDNFSDYLIMDATKEPYVLAPYSFPAPGTYPANYPTKRSMIDILGDPVSGKVFFAGEATEDGGATSTVIGALMTGERAAGEVDTQIGGPPTSHPPVSSFSASPSSGTETLTVNFTDQSSQSPTSWLWSFGDAVTSTLPNPSHDYAEGTYTVSLTATNADGSDVHTITDYITVPEASGPIQLIAGVLGLVALSRFRRRSAPLGS
jgi:monoamine oxidase